MICRNLAAVVAAAVLAGSAAGGTPLTLIQATLTSHIPVHAAAGTRFALSWRFANSQGSFDPAQGLAATIFVRLSSLDGKAATTTVAPPRSRPTNAPTLNAMLHPNANYRVVVTVPRGGIGRIEIGIRSRDITGFFPITNDPLKH